MPAIGTPPPSLGGILFVFFVILLMVIAPAALVIWLAWVLPWQITLGFALGLFTMPVIRRLRSR